MKPENKISWGWSEIKTACPRRGKHKGMKLVTITLVRKSYPMEHRFLAPLFDTKHFARGCIDSITEHEEKVLVGY